MTSVTTIVRWFMAIVLGLVCAADSSSARASSAADVTMKTAALCGAHGDGLTDDTGNVQNCIDGLPSGWALNGEGKPYLVRRLMLKSGITFENFHLIEKASSVQFDSPITVDGTRSNKSGIIVRDVSVEGNREAQMGMDSQPLEDGGRSCLRIIGTVTDVVLQRVQAQHCATDGLELSGGALSGNDADEALKIRNVVVLDSQFSYNRRHGISGQSLYNVSFIRVTCQFNGLDFDSSGAQGEGGRGARYHNYLYGTGLDFEGYGIGSALSGLSLIDVNATKNASAGLTLKDSASSAKAGFRPRRNIVILRGTYDVGHLFYPPEPFAIVVSAERANLNKVPELYDNVSVIGTELVGAIVLKSVRDAKIIGTKFGKVRDYPYWGVMSHTPGLHYLDIAAGDLRLCADESVAAAPSTPFQPCK